MTRFPNRMADATCRFRCGEAVIDEADPRHVGIVDRIRHGALVDVTWIETGWTGTIRQGRCLPAPRESYP